MSGGRSPRNVQNPSSGERRKTLSITHHALSPPPSHHHLYIIHLINWLQRSYHITMSLNHFTSRLKCMPGFGDPGVTIVNPTEISVMYGYVTWWMTMEISIMYGSEGVKRPFLPKGDVKQWFTTTTTWSLRIQGTSTTLESKFSHHSDTKSSSRW